jgi:CPA2 family monovalent cation:H+ antiporter-2
MLIAETEYRYQVEEDIKPFRDVLLGLFFVTVGMVLDLGTVARNLPWVVALLVVPVLAKFALIVVLSRLFGAAARDRAAHRLLSGAGGRVRAGAARARRRSRAAVENDAQIVLAAMVLSMLSAPLIIHHAERIVRSSRPTTGSRAPRRSRRSRRRRWRGRTT